MYIAWSFLYVYNIVVLIIIFIMTGQLRNVNCYVTKHSTGTTTRCYADQTLSRFREGVAMSDYVVTATCVCGLKRQIFFGHEAAIFSRLNVSQQTDRQTTEFPPLNTLHGARSGSFQLITVPNRTEPNRTSMLHLPSVNTV